MYDGNIRRDKHKGNRMDNERDGENPYQQPILTPVGELLPKAFIPYAVPGRLAALRCHNAHGDANASRGAQLSPFQLTRDGDIAVLAQVPRRARAGGGL